MQVQVQEARSKILEEAEEKICGETHDGFREAEERISTLVEAFENEKRLE